MATKILVSPGCGAGWSTWNDKKKQVAEYLPIIEFIESGGDPSELDAEHELIKTMKIELDLESFYCGGAKNLEIQHVDGPYLINEYDGNEYVQTSSDFWT